MHTLKVAGLQPRTQLLFWAPSLWELQFLTGLRLQQLQRPLEGEELPKASNGAFLAVPKGV